jgi:hypothetical protein
MRPGDMAHAIGKGLVAGAAGTVAITASRMLAQQLLHQEMPTAAAEAAEKLVGVEPKDEMSEAKLGMLTHFAYGSALGIPRALLARTHIKRWKADALHLAAVQSTAGAMLPTLHVGSAPSKTPPKQLGMDALHHAIYAVTTGAALRFLDRRRQLRRLGEAA